MINVPIAQSLMQLLGSDGPEDWASCVLQGVTDRSQDVRPGFAFVAYPGQRYDGRDHVLDAIARGARAVLYEADGAASMLRSVQHVGGDGVVWVPVHRCKEQLSLWGHRWYHQPSNQLTTVAVTGTNGKTSTAHFIMQALGTMGRSCGLISTLGYGLSGHDNLVDTSLTTPDALTLQRLLADLGQQGAEFVAFEASSHALDQHRLDAVAVDVAVLTNISQDHLDYHGDMPAYVAAKRRLFTFPSVRARVLNMNDPVGQAWSSDPDMVGDVLGYGMGCRLDADCRVVAEDVSADWQGLTFNLHTAWGQRRCRVPIAGTYQLNNVLATLTVLLGLGCPLAEAVDALEELRPIPGRMEVFGGADRPSVVVDYAHTPAALDAVLNTARGLTQGQLWCVFGCGGERDATKRPEMGRVAERLSDHLVITDDNPRLEDPEGIVRDIMNGLLCPWAASVEHDRAGAIAYAIQQAGPRDTVVVCGRGHETVQSINGQDLPMSDRLHVQMQLGVGANLG